ncbi:MAG TPA: helix-turn-helix domain-containing protein [Longimicrobium sp.]|nr:helix-turn-helix domain-containing protein [Longimicrobium sp.]
MARDTDNNAAGAPGFGDALIGALEEAVAFESGALGGLRVDRVEITARDVEVDPPPAYSAEHIQRIRKRLLLSQQVFAGMLNASPSAVRAWEQGQREPDGPTRRLLQVAEKHPEALADTLYGQAMDAYRARGWPLVLRDRGRPYGVPDDNGGK